MREARALAYRYTATATQTSSLTGNPSGTSAPVSFVVDTNPPTVTLEEPEPQLSNNATPSFSGAASEGEQGTKKIGESASAAAKPVTTLQKTLEGFQVGVGMTAIPKALEGYPVVIEVTGEIRPLAK